MTQPESSPSCLHCDASDQQVPLITLRYAARDAWICARCMPVLIHRTDELAAKLANMRESEGTRA